MLSFMDEKGKRFNGLAKVKRTRSVNGEKSLTGTVYQNDEIIHGVDLGWRLKFEDEHYVIIYANPVDNGNKVELEFDAVHEFFYEMAKSSVYSTLNGSQTMRRYLDFIFDGIDYDYVLDVTVPAFEKENFGMDSRLSLFNDIIKSAGVEFTINNRVVLIREKLGRDLTTIVRKGFNLNELILEKNINTFVTYKRAFGAYFDDEDHSKGRLDVEYESPLSSVFGRLEAPPINDERYSVEKNLYNRIKNDVDNSYEISVQVTMEDLRNAGYQYEQPNEGDYIMAINEDLNYRKRVRIVSYETTFDINGDVVDHDIVANSKGLVTTSDENKYEEILDVVNRVEQEVNRVQIGANNKTRVFRGPDEPTQNMQLNDLWYRPVGDGEVEMYRYTGEYWKLEKISGGLIAGELDASSGDLDIINMNANNITANRGNFVMIAMNEANSSVTFDGSKLRYTHSDGGYTQMASDGFKRFDSGTGRLYHHLVKVKKFVTTSSGSTAVNWIGLGPEFNFLSSVSEVNNAVSLSLSDTLTGKPAYEIQRAVVTQGHTTSSVVQPRKRGGQWEYPVTGYVVFNQGASSTYIQPIAGILQITA